MLFPRLAAGVLCAGLSSSAIAQETIELGVLKDQDVHVVQDILFPKTGRLEIGGHLGWMPFDPLVTTPNAQFSIDKHFSEELALSVLIGGGYGLTTAKYKELTEPPYNVAPNAYRYLASALIGVSWAPIYGKMTARGKSVSHYDVFFSGRLGGTLEQSVIPGGGMTVAPTLSLGVGARFFLPNGNAIRVELRDDLLVEYRALTTNWHFKQNAGITVGYTAFLGKAKGQR